MAYVITQPCIDLKDKPALTSVPFRASISARTISTASTSTRTSALIAEPASLSVP